MFITDCHIPGISPDSVYTLKQQQKFGIRNKHFLIGHWGSLHIWHCFLNNLINPSSGSEMLYLDQEQVL